MKKNRVWVGILFAVCILLSLIGIWKSVYVSADIDESYAFTMAVRIAGGERMFIDLWEPHQMSAFCMPLLYGFIRASPEIWMVLLFLCALWGCLCRRFFPSGVTASCAGISRFWPESVQFCI